MRILAQLAVLVGSLSLAASVVLFLRAIWTVGPDAGRYGGTGGVFFVVGLFLTFAGACWLDCNPPRGLR